MNFYDDYMSTRHPNSPIADRQQPTTGCRVAFERLNSGENAIFPAPVIHQNDSPAFLYMRREADRLFAETTLSIANRNNILARLAGYGVS